MKRCVTSLAQRNAVADIESLLFELIVSIKVVRIQPPATFAAALTSEFISGVDRFAPFAVLIRASLHQAFLLRDIAAPTPRERTYTQPT
jgi:hypothetical protein